MGRWSWYDDDLTDSSDERNNRALCFNEAWIDYYAEFYPDVNEEGEIHPEIDSPLMLPYLTQLDRRGERTGSSEGEHIMPTVAILSKKVDELKSYLKEMKGPLKSNKPTPAAKPESYFPSAFVIVLFLIVLLALWHDKEGVY